MLEDVKIMYTEDEIQNRIQELAIQIDRDYDGKEVVAICILKGAAFFTVDLVKKMQTPVIFEVMQVSSYAGTETTGTISIKKDLDCDIEGKDVLIVEDIIENNTHFLLPTLGTNEAYLYMNKTSGNNFKKAVKHGKWRDVDFLTSNFTGY